MSYVVGPAGASLEMASHSPSSSAIRANLQRRLQNVNGDIYEGLEWFRTALQPRRAAMMLPAVCKLTIRGLRIIALSSHY